MVIHGCLVGFPRHSGIVIEVLSPLCFLKHLKNEILFICITHACILMDMLAVWMVQYASRRKFSIPVKALPKLMLYIKYGTQRVVSRPNIAQGEAECYICHSPTLFVLYFTYSTHGNSSTHTNIYIYMYVCMYVCRYVLVKAWLWVL